MPASELRKAADAIGKAPKEWVAASVKTLAAELEPAGKVPWPPGPASVRTSTRGDTGTVTPKNAGKWAVAEFGIREHSVPAVLMDTPWGPRWGPWDIKKQPGKQAWSKTVARVKPQLEADWARRVEGVNDG
jgi:hypothetical protein